MGILTAIANGFKAIGAVFGWAQQRDAEENTAPMQANAAAATEQKIKDAATEAVTTNNLEEERKLAAE